MSSATNKSLTEEKATLFITLYARASDYRSKHSILHDRSASELVEKLGVDISKYSGFGERVTVLRAKQFDDWTLSFLHQYPQSLVVYLGCGLDTRINRIHPSVQTMWYDIDYPEVIEIRKKFFPERKGYTMLSSSVKEARWRGKIPAGLPALIIAEGILEYLSEDEVKILMDKLIRHFGHGEIVFDVMNTFAVSMGKQRLKEMTGAVHKWAVDDARTLDQLNARLKTIEHSSVLRSAHIRKLPARLRWTLKLASIFPKYKNMLQLVHMMF